MKPCLECLHIPNPQPTSKKIKIKEMHEKGLKIKCQVPQRKCTKNFKTEPKKMIIKAI